MVNFLSISSRSTHPLALSHSPSPSLLPPHMPQCRTQALTKPSYTRTMAYPSSYAQPASSHGNPNNSAGTGYASSSSYDKPYAGPPSSYPNPIQQQHQNQPQRLYLNDSMLVSALSLTPFS